MSCSRTQSSDAGAARTATPRSRVKHSTTALPKGSSLFAAIKQSDLKGKQNNKLIMCIISQMRNEALLGEQKI